MSKRLHIKNNVYLRIINFKDVIMKKVVFTVLFAFLAVNVYCQQVPIGKDQEKAVSRLHRDVTKELNDIAKQTRLSAADKKNRVDAVKRGRDAKLAEILSPDQIAAMMVKDPVDWNRTLNKIDEAEMEQQLREVENQEKGLERQQDEIKLQLRDLKETQKDLGEKQKALKAEKKAIKQRRK